MTCRSVAVNVQNASISKAVSSREQRVIVLLGKTPGRHYNHREILPNELLHQNQVHP
jgi:hypothetical protein